MAERQIGARERRLHRGATKPRAEARGERSLVNLHPGHAPEVQRDAAAEVAPQRLDAPHDARPAAKGDDNDPFLRTKIQNHPDLRSALEMDDRVRGLLDG